MSNKVHVNLKSDPYFVHIGYNNFSDILTLADELNLNKNVFALIDKNVFKAHKNKILNAFKGLTKFDYLLFNSNENNKNLETIQKIYKTILDKGYNRNSTFVAIGGGIVGDLFGFVSATFMRGVNYIQVPTTLLSCVDSSVGGKTGYNFLEYKNIIGSIYQPSFVLMDTMFLESLNQSEIINGLGEIIKTCFLISEKQSEEFKNDFGKLISLDNASITNIITECVKFKAGVVSSDEKEVLGIRKILNLGHTFGHAIEKETNFKMPHGQAVIVGTVCSLYLSFQLNLISSQTLFKSLEIFDVLSPFVKVKPFDLKSAYESMKKDKKSQANIIKFVLLKNFGDILVDVEADKNEVLDALQEGINFFENK